MSTLAKKQLVTKLNTVPAKYSLTDSGRMLAITLTGRSVQLPNKENMPKTYNNPVFQPSYNTFSPEKEVVHSYPMKSSYQSNEVEMDEEDLEIIDSDDFPQSNPKKIKTSAFPKSSDNLEILIDDSDSDSLPDVRDVYPSKNLAQTSIIPKKSTSSKKLEPMAPLKKPCDNKPIEKVQPNFSHPTLSTNQSFDITTKPKLSDPIMTLEPNDYEIILILDTCETSHA